MKLLFFVFAVLLNVMFLFAQKEATVGKANDLKDILVACYYFPNYHTRSKNDPRISNQHWENWSEWELVKRAKPRFEGHHQPNVPEWGYTDEKEPKVMKKKIQMAVEHGIDVFIFDWYNYNGNNTPENFKKALQMTKEVLLNEPDSPDILNINCWNEWPEGSYLEPDMVHGTAYLDVVKEVMGE